MIGAAARRVALAACATDPDVGAGPRGRRPAPRARGRGGAVHRDAAPPGRLARGGGAAASCGPTPTSATTTSSRGSTSRRRRASSGGPSTSTTVFGRVDVPPPAEGADDGRGQRGPGRPDRRRGQLPADGTGHGRSPARSRWRRSTASGGSPRSTTGWCSPQDDVEETFRQVSLYFLSPLRNRLVPDTVLLPQLPGLSTKLVSRLLRGPTDRPPWCRRDRLPAGDDAGGAVGAGPGRPGDGAPRRGRPRGRRRRAPADVGADRLDAQADRSRDRPGAHHGGRRGHRGLRRPRGAAARLVADLRPQRADRQPRRSTPCATGAVGRVIEGKFDPVPGPAGTGELPLRSPAVSLDESRLAAVTADGRSLHVGPLADGAPFDRVASGGDIGRPSWDPQGNLWFVDRATGAISVLPGRRRAAGPGHGGQAARRRRPRLAVSRDGARVALVTGTGASARLLVATLRGVDQLERDSPDTAKVSLQAAREVLPDLRGVRDVAWADAQTLAVIGSRGGLPAGVMYTTTDGYEVSPVQADPDLVGLAATPPLRPQASPLVVATAEGQLQGRHARQLGRPRRGQRPDLPRLTRLPRSDARRRRPQRRRPSTGPRRTPPGPPGGARHAGPVAGVGGRIEHPDPVRRVLAAVVGAGRAGRPRAAVDVRRVRRRGPVAVPGLRRGRWPARRDCTVPDPSPPGLPPTWAVASYAGAGPRRRAWRTRRRAGACCRRPLARPRWRAQCRGRGRGGRPSAARCCWCPAPSRRCRGPRAGPRPDAAAGPVRGGGSCAGTGSTPGCVRALRVRRGRSTRPA